VEKCTQLDHRKKLNILFIIGNVCRDVTYRVAAFPKPGETILALATTYDLGGKGFNQAVAAQRAGQDTRLVAAVGTDDIGKDVSARLSFEGINVESLILQAGPSDSSMVLVDEKGENFIVSSTAQAEALAFENVIPRLDFAASDTLLLQGNLSRNTTRSAAISAKTAGATVVLNAAPFRDWLPELAKYIDILVVNEIELFQWTGRDPTEALDAVTQSAGVDTVVTTLGSEGCRIRLSNGDLHSIATPQTRVVDTTGAGDVFTGTYVSEWMSSRDHLRAAILAVHVASDKVGRFGSSTAFPSVEKIKQLRKKISAARPLAQSTR
jgi:ribokinase